MEQAGEGQAAVLFLVGEAGLGKTTLLGWAKAAAPGFTQAEASCSEVDGSLPFGLFDQLLSCFAGPGAPQVGRQSLRASAEARARRYGAALAQLRELGHRPLLLGVDDLHWADPDSLDLLSLLCRRLGGLAVAVVATVRPWPPLALERAQALAHDGFARVVQLAPLSDEASARLLAEHLGEAVAGDPGFVERAWRACAGNPLLLAEVAGAARAGVDVLGASAGSLAQRLFLPRFAGVGGPALRWARAASVLGAHFDPRLVPALTGQSGPDATRALEALCHAGLVRAAPGPGGRAEFVHPLFRQVLYDDIAPPVRQGLHAAAFRALVGQGAPAAEAAAHALAANLSGDQRAIDVLSAAGREALVAGAVSTAVRHFEGAARLAGSRAPARLSLELAQAYLSAGQVERGEQAVRPVLSHQELSAQQRVAALVLLAEAVRGRGRVDEARRCFEEASRLAAGFDPDLAVRIPLDAAFIGWYFVGPRAARDWVARAVAIAEASGGLTPSAREAVRLADAYLAFLAGSPAGAEELARAARAQLAGGESGRLGPGPPAWKWDVAHAYANVARFSDRFEEAEEAFSWLMAAARDNGAMLSYNIFAVAQGYALCRQGRLQLARSLLTGVAEMAELAPALAPFAFVGLAALYLELGADDESQAWSVRAEQALASRQWGPSYPRLWLCQLACRRALARGEVGSAVAMAEQAAQVAQSSGIGEPCVVPWHGSAIEAFCRSGQLGRAEELVSSLEAACQAVACRSPRATAYAGRALVAWRRAKAAEAQEMYEAALACYAGVPVPLAQAEVQLAYARFLRQSGQLARARQLLHRTAALLEPLGAGRLYRAVAEELAIAGGRRRTARHPANALSAQEQRVAALAAAGLTNVEIAAQLYMSAKTVEHHLSRVYAKTGARSRRELMLGGAGPLKPLGSGLPRWQGQSAPP